MAHRYFMQNYGLLVRGFEPARIVNASHTGHADVLSNRVPHFVELLLDESRAAQGFLLEDAASLVMTLERLIFDSESTMLEEAYQYDNRNPQRRLHREALSTVMETYMVHWALGDDKETLQYALRNPNALNDGFPHWRDIRAFVEGQIDSMDFAHAQQPNKQRGLMLGTYTFDDAHEVVGSITKSFASYWESVCQELKSTLVTMDRSGSGRVPLSQFYGSALTHEARFGESEAYLRDLGALDETSMWQGKQVLIANYMQAASNCIVSGPNYLVCCMNECEVILGEIEAEIGAPEAMARDILRVVQNISSPSSEDDVVPVLTGPLTTQMERLADLHNGKVPLHSRLMAQWLHYVYPRECPFPHKAGTHSVRTPTEYGGNHLATEADMRVHVETRTASTESEYTDEARWESDQWSEEEEVLFAGRSIGMRAPWEARNSYATAGGAVAAFVVAAWLVATRSGKQDRSLIPTSHFDIFEKGHLV
jgi:hypothetical protein